MSLPPLPPGFKLDRPRAKPQAKRGAPSRVGRPTGEAHDGDTFRLDTGANARLYGVDAFELDQTGRTRAGGTSLLGQQARAALLPYAQPGAIVSDTGGVTYGRPVVSLDNNGDAGSALLRQGLALTTPRYLRNDQTRFQDYTQEERQARLNQRGAFAGTFQTPEDYRHGKPDPWATPTPGTFGDGNTQAVFWDNPTPFQGLKPEVEQGYAAVFQDMSSTPEDLMAYAKANGFAVDRGTVLKAYAQRTRAGKAGANVEYVATPRVLTNPKDGAFGAAVRGFADPINILDEAGAVVNSLLPSSDRESIWSSGRRFGDVYANNLEQNRSILDYDEANNKWARFGGQLVSGAVIPGLSAEGVGFATARQVLQNGGGRFAAKMAARRAVRNQLALGGALEGTAAGVGQGETWQGRASGGVMGGAVGAALGAGTGALAPHVADALAPIFSRLSGKEGERIADDFADGAMDAGRARTSNAASDAEKAGLTSQPADTGRRVVDFGSPTLPTRARKAIRERRRLSPEQGSFGPIHYKLADPKRWQAGVRRLSEDGEGELPGAIQHPDIGNVDVVWGNDRVGLKPFVGDDASAADDLPRIIETMPVVERPNANDGGRFVLDDGEHRAVIAPDYDGDTKRWLVETFERKSAGASPAPDAPTTPAVVADEGANVQAMASDLDAPTLNGPEIEGTPTPTVAPRPLTADVTDAERMAAADRLEPRDVLPLPSNAVDGLDEAARIERGRFDPVRATDEAKVLEARSIPHARTGTPISVRGPLDLASWLRMEGGVRPVGGELEHLGITNAPRKGMEMTGGDRLGPLVNKEGMSYDDAAERAWEAGFFPDSPERPTINEFLDALDATHSGRSRVFRPDDLPEVEAYHAAQQQRVDVERAQDAGAPLTNDRAEPVGLGDLDRNAPPVAAYEEWGENAPNLAGNIRLDKLNSPQEIKRALLQTERVTGGFDAARRGHITQAEIANLASDLSMTTDDLLQRRKGQAFNAEEALAARQILARSATDLVNMARRLQRVEKPGDDMEAAFKQAWLRHVAIQEQVSGATAEAGRALAAFRIAADARKVDRVLPSLGDIAGGTTRLKDFADSIVDLEAQGVGAGGVNSFAAKALKPRFRDKLTELYYNSLLSNPATHAVNVMSNTMTALGQLPEYATAAVIGRSRAAFAGKQADRVLMSEVGARAVGLVAGAREGMRQAARTFVTGQSPDAISKLEQDTQRAIGGKVGSLLRTPTRALAAEDELFKAIARRMELAGLSVRAARKEGLTGEAARQRSAALMADPTDDMLARSFDYGRYLTFQTPLGEAGRSVTQFTEAMPISKLVLPFVRTPTNILKFAIERSPAAPILKEWRRDIIAGGAARDLAVAKVLTGTGIAATVFQLAGEGRITGNGPADPAARALLQADGWQPYSIKVGDKYVSFSRLDPYASILGTAADLVDLQSHMTDKQRQHSALLVGTAVLHNLSSKTFLGGLSDFLEAISDPDRSLESWASRMIGGIAVPAIVAQTARLVDPVLRDARDPISRIRSRIPGASESLATKRDIFGRPVELEGGVGPDFASPMSITTRRNDPTVRALLSAESHISRPARKTGDHELTDIEYDRYQEAIGNLAKPRLDALVRNPDWLAASKDDKQDAVSGLMKKARGEARADLFGAPVRQPRASAKPQRDDLPPLPPGFRMEALPPLPAGLKLDHAP